MDKMNFTQGEREFIIADIKHKEAELLRMQRTELSTKDYEPLSIIGRGAFGEVRICKERKTGEIVAIKKLLK